jgi:hypothetical protein
MKYTAVLLFFFSTFIRNAQENKLVWTRALEAGNYTITLYQPQFETLVDNKLKGRMVLSVKPDKPSLFLVLYGSNID